MNKVKFQQSTRRKFLERSFKAGSLVGAGLLSHGVYAGGSSSGQTLYAGEGTVDITPQVGTVMAGFHYKPGSERLVGSVRDKTEARAVVLQLGKQLAAIVSVDICAVSHESTQRLQKRISEKTGIPANAIRLCATHTHSAPTLRFFRLWGGLPEKYVTETENRIVKSVEIAKADLAPADLSIGKSRTEGANFNRTRKDFKKDIDFNAQSSEEDRWLDTMLHTLHFDRGTKKKNLLWYQFSAHPVCYADGEAGPDWPGIVAKLISEQENLTPSFLQGHTGDVNPGDGTPWRGDAEQTARQVAVAIRQAISNAQSVKPNELRIATEEIKLPLDLELMNSRIEQYRKNPEKCASGPFVDAPFAKAWFNEAQKWNPAQTDLPTTVSMLQLGNNALLFHSSELFSYYGLQIQLKSSLENTIMVGYTDGFIGYLTDPTSHKNGEYAASVVPKLLNLPPFVPTATQTFSSKVTNFLKAKIS